jgi:hypothetical protein
MNGNALLAGLKALFGSDDDERGQRPRLPYRPQTGRRLGAGPSAGKPAPCNCTGQRQGAPVSGVRTPRR